MQWAEGGSLDDFIDVRMGRVSANRVAPFQPSGSTLPTENAAHCAGATPESLDPTAVYSRSARIRAFRALQQAPVEQREQLRRAMTGFDMRVPGSNEWQPVHLFSAEEVKSLFTDVVEGLAFLVRNSLRCALYIETDSRHVTYSMTDQFCTWT